MHGLTLSSLLSPLVKPSRTPCSYGAMNLDVQQTSRVHSQNEGLALPYIQLLQETKQVAPLPATAALGNLDSLEGAQRSEGSAISTLKSILKKSKSSAGDSSEEPSHMVASDSTEKGHSSLRLHTAKEVSFMLDETLDQSVLMEEGMLSSSLSQSKNGTESSSRVTGSKNRLSALKSHSINSQSGTHSTRSLACCVCCFFTSIVGGAAAVYYFFASPNA